VFAYGATGAGKTHTMLGNDEQYGIMGLTFMELFKKIEEQKKNKEFKILMSYLEIYNENIRDLLI
jgi:kinesin family protein 18/19